MKPALIVLFFISFSASGQSVGIQLYSKKLMRINYMQLERMVAVDRQRERVEALQRELERVKQDGVITAEMVHQLQEQNKVLRQQMQEYQQKIDELNQKNSELIEEPNKSE